MERSIGIIHSKRFNKDFWSVHLFVGGEGMRVYGSFRSKSKAEKRGKEMAVKFKIPYVGMKG